MCLHEEPDVARDCGTESFVLESLNLAWEFEPSLRTVCVDGSQDYFHIH